MPAKKKSRLPKSSGVAPAVPQMTADKRGRLATRLINRMNASAELRHFQAGSPPPVYERIGPDHPMHHENMAKRTAVRAETDTAKARELIEEFIAAIEQHSAQTWRQARSPFTYFEYADFVAKGLRRMLENDAEDARVSLGLKSSAPGRRAGKTIANYKALAAAQALLIAHGVPRKKVYGELKDRIPGASKKTIDRAREEFPEQDEFCRMAKDAVERPDDRDHLLELLKVNAEPYASIMSAILDARISRRRS